MQRKRHTREQIIKKLREADAMLATGKTIGQVAQALEMNEQTFQRWRNQYGGMKSEEARRLKELDEENKRLKKPGLPVPSGIRVAVCCEKPYSTRTLRTPATQNGGSPRFSAMRTMFPQGARP